MERNRKIQVFPNFVERQTRAIGLNIQPVGAVRSETRAVTVVGASNNVPSKPRPSSPSSSFEASRLKVRSEISDPIPRFGEHQIAIAKRGGAGYVSPAVHRRDIEGLDL